MSQKNKKYFDILGLKTNATLDEIKQARKDLLSMLHPDKHQGNENKRKLAEFKSKEINNAYDKLTKLGNSDSNFQEETSNSDDTQQYQSQELTKEQQLVLASRYCKAINDIVEMDKNHPNLNSKTLVTYRIKDTRTSKNILQPIAILGTIISISDPLPVPVSINGVVESVPSTCITIKDSADDEIYFLPSDYSVLIKDNYTGYRGLLRFIGFVIPIEKKGYFFYLKEIERNLNTLDIIGLNPNRKDEINKKYIEAAKYPGGVRSFIKHALVKNLAISGLDKAVELNKAIDFMILQSFSYGMEPKDGKYSNKLHSLVIGPPAVGKKLLTKIALILNPVAYELPSTPNKLTMAGLVGNVVRGKGKTTSNPGYLPKASGGIICIQDFHEYISGGGKSSNLFSTLSKLMEDGEVIDSTMARTTHKAITAIHFDMNRLSQVMPNKTFHGHEDIGIKTNILSRFDFILEIPRNDEIQMQVADQIIDSWKDYGNYMSINESTPNWIRDLKIIVAHHTSNFSNPEFDSAVEDYIHLKKAQFRDTYSLKMTGCYHLSDFEIRLTNSLKKFVEAIACSRSFSTVRKEFVDEAFSFIKHKFDFLVSIETSPFKRDKASDRREMIVTQFNNREVKKSEIKKYIISQTGQDIADKTISRDVDKLISEGRANKVRQTKATFIFNESEE